MPDVKMVAGKAVEGAIKEQHEYPPEGEAEHVGECDPFHYFDEFLVREKTDNMNKNQHMSDLIYDHYYFYTSFE